MSATQTLNGTESVPGFLNHGTEPAPPPALQPPSKPKTPLATDEEYALVGLPPEGAIRALKQFCLHNLRGTPFLPKSIVKDLNEDSIAGTLLAVMLTGREMGFTPMQCLRVFWMSPDGRLGMYADGMMALMLRAGAKFRWVHLENDGAELHTTRKDGNEYVAKFYKQDADAAGLYNKSGSLYLKYPRRMFRARVIGETYNTLFSDLGGGQMYTQEELQDMIEPDGSANLTARELANQEADKTAALDPGLTIAPKSARQEVIEIKPEPASNPGVTPETAKKPEPPAIAKKTTAVKETPQPEPPPPPQQPTAQEIYHELKDKVMDSYGGVTIKDHFVPCCKGYFGGSLPKEETAYHAVLRALIEVSGIPAVQRMMREDPQQLGRNLKTAESMPEPEPTAAAEPETTTGNHGNHGNQETAVAETKETKETKEPQEPPFEVAAEPTDAYTDAFPAWTRNTRDMARQVFSGIEREHRSPQAQYINGMKSFKLEAVPDDEASALLTLIHHNRVDVWSIAKIVAAQPELSFRKALAVAEEKAGHPLNLQNANTKTKGAITSALTELRSNA